MLTHQRSITIVLGIMLLSAALLACGPLALLNRSNDDDERQVIGVTVVVETPVAAVATKAVAEEEVQPTSTPPAPTATRAPLSLDPVAETLSEVEAAYVLFFESGVDLTPYDERVYDAAFPQASSRYIAWELNLDYPEPGEQVDFEIYAIWYGPDGQILAEQTMDDAYLGADWTSSAHAMGWGWDDPGEWDPGKYSVDLYVGDDLMATGSFEIVADAVSDTIDIPSAGPTGRIAFVSERDGNRDIYVINADGTGEVRLTDVEGEDEEPAWSPDGEQITFYSYRDGNGELYVVSADGSSLERLTMAESDEWSPVWSPDGAWIVFSSDRDGERHLWAMPADSRESDGSDWVRVTAPPGADWKFDWSPDGTTIIFDSDRDGVRQLYTVPAPGADGQTNAEDYTLFLTDDNGIFDAAWSPDGEYLAFTATKPMANGRIDMIAADGSGRTTLTEDRAGDAAPTWSPDGQWIAFTSYRDGEGDIFIMAAPNGPMGETEPFNLTETANVDDGWPAWSPD
jgi:WD40 repeat protein